MWSIFITAHQPQSFQWKLIIVSFRTKKKLEFALDSVENLKNIIHC